MAMKSDNQASLIELDFAKPDIPKEAVPIALLFDRVLYRLTSWQELVKIFCYLTDKTVGGKEFFAAHVDRFFYFANGAVSLSDSVGAKKKIVFCDYQKSYDSDIKFSSDCYIRIQWLDLIDIVSVLHDVIQSLGLDGVKVYLGKHEKSRALTDELLKDLNKGKKRDRYIEKNSKYFIARINNEVLLPQEKFYKRIEREFDRKVLIGDISISGDEEKYLHDYMAWQLRKLNHSGKISKYYLKVFAYGLVRFAMKYYSQKTFWRYFKEEYGFDIKVNMQSELHDWFRCIMEKYSKAYDNYVTMKIDNISMHCFVTDRCADQLFDYLFDFWRGDLSRNIENLYVCNTNGEKYFDSLLAKIKANNDVSINNVMKHTSMAVAAEGKSCRLRLRRILELIDGCFWNGSEIPQTGNRMNELLRKWMQLPNGKFQKEQKIAIAIKKGGRGETLLSSPVLCAKLQAGSFYLRLPREILKDYSEGQENPIWEVKIGENSFSVSTILCEGKIGYYTEECEFQIPPELLFRQMKISLDCLQKAPYTIKEDSYRFFSEKGALVDRKNNLPCGLLVLYAETGEIPQKLYGEETVPEPYDGMFVATYQAGEGDILLFPDKKAVQVGQRIKEGLIGTPLQGVTADADGTGSEVYGKLPKLLFRAKREQVAGAALFVEDGREQTEILRVKESYVEFKLDDMLEDVYGYLIDLCDDIRADGFYRIRLSLPSSTANIFYQFAYLKDLEFEFVGKPYLFANAGKIKFSASAKIETNSEWELLGGRKTLPFVLDSESRDCSKYVQGRDICLNYQLRDRSLPLKFRIPAFYWKFKKEAEWRTRPPADLSIRKIPSTLYVCGPYDFKSSKISIERILLTSFETEITPQKVSGEDCFAFNFSELKSFLDHSVAKRTVLITLNGTRRSLLNIICRSYVASASIAPDYENNKLIGQFKIIGGSEYCAKVERDGTIIGQDIPVVDGTFELETDALGGNYLVTLYEIFEDESGFDAELVKLGKYPLKLTDITKLQDRSVEIVSIQDREKKYTPLMLPQRHIIGNLQYLGRYQDVCDMEVNGLWSMDFYDEEQMRSCFFYRGALAEGIKDFRSVCSVMIIFPDRLDLTRCVILREDGKEFVEPLYDYKTHSLIATDSGMSKLQKKERITTLEDDRYDFSVKIGDKIVVKNL